jgi:hypothetical protein
MLLPKEYGSGSTCHRRFQQLWIRLDIFKKDISLPKINGGLSRREQTLGTIDSESCFQGMKRRLRTTLVWCNYHAVSLSIKR